MSSLNKFEPKIVDFSIYNELNKRNKKLILKAEKCNEDSLIYVSSSFIIGKNDFPQNESIGIQYLIYGTDNNVMKAIEQYGTHLLLGEFVAKDEEKAIELLNKVATKRRDSNKKLSLVEVILSHQAFDVNSEEKNSDVNYVLAKEICKEAADLGNVKAMVQYGKLCLMHQKNKFGKIKADFQEAFKYFVKASQKGDADGMFYHGNFLENGFGGVEIDLKEAAKLYKKSYEKGSFIGYAFYGYTFIDKKFGNLNEVEGLRLIKYSCDKNCPHGINTFAYLIDMGIAGIEKDESRSFDYYKKAAELGNYVAMNNVGTFYKDGNIVEQDLDLAIKYFQFAYNGGSLIAANNLANIYSEEKYNRIDKKKAAKLFKKSFEFGFKRSLNDYCWLLLKDEENLEKNLPDLKKYLDIGRSIKDVDTMRLQAALYLDGGKVYDKNQQLGIQILKECTELGSEDAISDLIKIYEKGDDNIKPNEKEVQKYRNMLTSPKSQCCLLI